MKPISEFKLNELTQVVAGMCKSLEAQVELGATPIDIILRTSEFCLEKEKLNRKELALLYATSVGLMAAMSAKARVTSTNS